MKDWGGWRKGDDEFERVSEEASKKQREHAERDKGRNEGERKQREACRLDTTLFPMVPADAGPPPGPVLTQHSPQTSVTSHYCSRTAPKEN